MRTRTILVPLAATLACLALTAAAPAQAAPSAPPAAQAVLIKMIDAVKAQSFDDFLTDASARLKSQFTRQQFEGICGLYTAPLRKGYKLDYLGQLRQREATVHLWKVSVPDAADETLLRLILKDGKVDGFSVH